MVIQTPSIDVRNAHKRLSVRKRHQRTIRRLPVDCSGPASYHGSVRLQCERELEHALPWLLKRWITKFETDIANTL